MFQKCLYSTKHLVERVNHKITCGGGVEQILDGPAATNDVSTSNRIPKHRGCKKLLFQCRLSISTIIPWRGDVNDKVLGNMSIFEKILIILIKVDIL